MNKTIMLIGTYSVIFFAMPLEVTPLTSQLKIASPRFLLEPKPACTLSSEISDEASILSKAHNSMFGRYSTQTIIFGYTSWTQQTSIRLYSQEM